MASGGQRPDLLRSHSQIASLWARNRIIAAMSQGTVVVEAAHRSGARNTATWAVDCGRQLMAVPGPVYSALSAGPHQLVREGKATLVTSGSDVVELVSAMGSF